MGLLIIKPDYKARYMDDHGKHFSRELYEWAVANMSDKEGQLKPWTIEEVMDAFTTSGMTIKHDYLWDYMFVANMVKADYWGGSIADLQSMAMYVKEYLDDPDGYEGVAFCRFLADCKAIGREIPWRDVI